MNRPYQSPPSPLGPGQKRSGNPFASRTGWAFFLALVVGACLMYYAEVHLRQQEQLGELEQRTVQLEEKLAGSREMADQLNVYRKTTERLQMLILEAEVRIPHDLEIPSLTAAIMRTAGQFSATVTRFEPLPAVRKGELTRVPIALEMEATRKSLFAFFEELVSLDRRMNVKHLSIVRIQGKGEASVLKIGCEVEAFALESPK